jgi:hypothetical protein
MISYDFREGQLVRLFHGVPEEAWTIYEAPTEELRACIKWNDKNGDFDELDRLVILEIFLFDFIVSKER